MGLLGRFLLPKKKTETAPFFLDIAIPGCNAGTAPSSSPKGAPVQSERQSRKLDTSCDLDDVVDQPNQPALKLV